MKKYLCILMFLLLLTGTAQAAELPRELTEALPEAAEEVVRTEPSAFCMPPIQLPNRLSMSEAGDGAGDETMPSSFPAPFPEVCSMAFSNLSFEAESGSRPTPLFSVRAQESACCKCRVVISIPIEGLLSPHANHVVPEHAAHSAPYKFRAVSFHHFARREP